MQSSGTLVSLKIALADAIIIRNIRIFEHEKIQNQKFPVDSHPR